jgi:hypothetical protein
MYERQPTASNRTPFELPQKSQIVTLSAANDKIDNHP